MGETNEEEESDIEDSGEMMDESGQGLEPQQGGRSAAGAQHGQGGGDPKNKVRKKKTRTVFSRSQVQQKIKYLFSKES